LVALRLGLQGRNVGLRHGRLHLLRLRLRLRGLRVLLLRSLQICKTVL
jgi:hypothetical protein